MSYVELDGVRAHVSGPGSRHALSKSEKHEYSHEWRAKGGYQDYCGEFEVHCDHPLTRQQVRKAVATRLAEYAAELRNSLFPEYWLPIATRIETAFAEGRLEELVSVVTYVRMTICPGRFKEDECQINVAAAAGGAH